MALIEASCHCQAVSGRCPSRPHCTNAISLQQSHRHAAELRCRVATSQFKRETMPERVGANPFGTHTVRHCHCNICGMPFQVWPPAWRADGKPDFDHPVIASNMRLAPTFDRSKPTVDRLDGKRFQAGATIGSAPTDKLLKR